MDLHRTGSAQASVGSGLTLITAMAALLWPAMPKWIMWVGFSLGILLTVRGCLELARPYVTRLIMSKLSRFIPLGTAALLAYERVENTLSGRLARRSRHGALSFMAQRVFYSVPVVMGSQPPSTKLHPVPNGAGHSFRFSSDCNDLLNDEDKVIYHGLRISRSDWKDALRLIENEADGITSDGEPPADSMIPLREAVGEALACTRKTEMGGWYIGMDEETIVSGFFGAMYRNDVPLYCKTPPAKDWGRVTSFDPSSETLVGMSAIEPHGSPVRLTEISVRGEDLLRFIHGVNAGTIKH